MKLATARPRLLPGREGDAVIKAPQLSPKLIVLKGLTYEKAKENESIICDLYFIEQLIEKAQVVGKFRELPHCIVIYSADVIAQEVAEELGVEVELIEVDEVTGGTHYAPKTRGSRYPENFEPEPYYEPEDVAAYVEDIEKSFEYSTEEEKAEDEEAAIEDVKYTHLGYTITFKPVVRIEVEGEDVEYEVPVEVLRTEKHEKPIREVELTLKVSIVREKGKYEYPYVNFAVKGIPAELAGKTVKVVVQLDGTTVTRYTTVKVVKEKGKYTYGYVTIMARLPREMIALAGKSVKARVTVLPA